MLCQFGQICDLKCHYIQLNSCGIYEDCAINRRTFDLHIHDFFHYGNKINLGVVCLSTDDGSVKNMYDLLFSKRLTKGKMASVIENLPLNV